MLEHTYDAGICVMTKITNLIGGKWKPIILFLIQHDVNRFGSLKKSMPRISKEVLANQLRELEQDNLIHRDVKVATAPQVVVYSLTPNGISLRKLIDEMIEWALHFLGMTIPKNCWPSLTDHGAKFHCNIRLDVRLPFKDVIQRTFSSGFINSFRVKARSRRIVGSKNGTSTPSITCTIFSACD